MNSIFSFFKKTFAEVVLFLKRLGTKHKWVTVVAVIIVVGIVGYAIFGPGASNDDGEIAEDVRTVTLIPAVTFAEGNSGNSTVTAGSETVIRAETSGKITEVRPVGSRVSAGATIAVFENAGQRAALLQAEGALESAEASLNKVRGGLRSEKIAVLETAVSSAQNSAVATLLSAYGIVDSAIRDTADQMFSNPESSTPKLNFSSSNNQRLTQLENERIALGKILDRQSSVSTKISSDSNIKTELSVTEDELRDVRAFIDTLIAALNEAIATGSVSEANIASYKSDATSARTALTGALSSIASARGSLETAEKNLEEGLTGAEDTELAGAAASVKQAQGSYDAALASYQKTIVRTSASGTIVSCSAAVGDVISVGNDVCRVKTVSGVSADSYTLPLSSVKYTPAGAFVFVVNENGILETIEVQTGLVSAGGIVVTGLFGDEYIVQDVRGLKAGEKVSIVGP